MGNGKLEKVQKINVSYGVNPISCLSSCILIGMAGY